MEGSESVKLCAAAPVSVGRWAPTLKFFRISGEGVRMCALGGKALNLLVTYSADHGYANHNLSLTRSVDVVVDAMVSTKLINGTVLVLLVVAALVRNSSSSQ